MTARGPHGSEGAANDGNQPPSSHGYVPPPYLPKFYLGILSAVLLGNALSVTVLFPFLGLLVEHLGMTSDRRKLGYYAGFIGSAFMIGRVFSSYIWGLVADKYGRKPVLLSGLASTALLMLAFGFSFSYEWAISVRILTGLMNGILGTAKAMTSELCGPEHQAGGMSVISAVWGMGLVLGPSIGGLFSDPAEKLPGMFPPDGVFGHFPYLLPCLTVSVLCAISFIASAIYLPETLPPRATEPGSHRDESSGTWLPTGSKEQRYARLNEVVDPEEEEDVVATSHARRRPSEDLFLVGNEEASPDDDDHASASSLVAPSEKESDVGNNSEPAREEDRALYLRPTVLWMIFLYTVMSLQAIFLDEVLPLWALVDQNEMGLGIGSSEIGYMMGAVGITMIIFQVFCFTPVADRFAKLTMFRWSLLGQAPLVLLLSLGRVAAGTSMFWPTMLGILGTRACLGNICFVSCFLLINNSVPTVECGRVNGLSMTFSSIGKAIGPATGASMLAWSLTNDMAFPLDFHFTFVLTAAVLVLIAVGSLWLPNSLNHPYDSVTSEAPSRRRESDSDPV